MSRRNCCTSVRLPVGPPGVQGPVGPGGISEIFVGNSVFVSKEGNDSTGLRERFDKMFLTVQAAINAAISGDTVFIYPGTYGEIAGIILKNGVNLYLDSNTIITGPGFGAEIVEDTICTISGEGKIYGLTDTGIQSVVPNTSTITIIGVEIGHILRTTGIFITDGSVNLILRNMKIRGKFYGIAYSGIPANSQFLILDDVIIATNSAFNIESITATNAQNIKIYSAVATISTKFNITNVISGTTMYVDPAII